MPVRLIVAALILCGITAAQEAFEVASVKPTDSNEPIVAWRSYPGGRVVITNFTLQMLIEEAYDVSLYRITGGPAWISTDFYTITAKAPAGSPAAAFVPPKPDVPPSSESHAMMRALLADRFGLKLHRETRELPVYALVIAKGGPKFQPTPDPSAEPKSSIRAGEIKGENRNMTWLTGIIERHLNQTVLDQTGLSGSYDLQLKFDPRAPLNPDESVGSLSNATRPPFNIALETQLGVRLKRTKGAVEILVIDDAKKPSAN